MSFDDNFFTCKYDNCSKRLELPVALPCCGKTICKKHTESFYIDNDKRNIKCLMCNNEYQLPPDGLKINEILNNLLTQSFGKEHKCATEVCEKLNENIQKFQHSLQDPEYFIYEYFKNVKNTIDLKREEVKENIDNHYDNLMKHVDNLETDLKVDLKLDLTNFNTKLEELKEKHTNFLNELNKNCPNSSSDWTRLENEIKTANSGLLQEMDEFKIEIFKNRLYHFYVPEIDLENLGRLIEYGQEESKYNLISYSDDSSVKVWDLITGKCLTTLKEHTGSVMCAIPFTATKILSSDDNGAIKLYDLTTNTCIKTFEFEDSYAFVLLKVSENQFLSGTVDGLVSLWDINESKPIRDFEFLKRCNFLVKYSDNKIVCCAEDHTIKIWDINKKECLNTLKGHKDDINDLKLLPNNKMVSCSDDYTIRIWDLTKSKCIQTINETDEVVFLAVLPDNKLLFVTETYFIESENEEMEDDENSSVDDEEDRIDEDAGDEGDDDDSSDINSENDEEQDDDSSVSSDSNNDLMTKIKIWDLDKNECIKTFPLTDYELHDVRLLSKNKLLVASSDNYVRIWDIEKLECISKLSGHSDAVRGIDLIEKVQN